VLLSFVAAVALGLGAVRWWIAWPKRAAQEFINLVAQRDFEKVKPLLAVTPDDVHASIGALYHRDCVIGETEKWQASKLRANLVMEEPGTLAEIAKGRADFLLDDIGYEFRIERGRVIRENIAGGWGIIAVDKPECESFWLDSPELVATNR
jgi:hypothetical protein